jgi:hypothetical protein
MLYDTRWGVSKIVVDPVSLDGLIAWLEQQDPSTRYDYSSNCGCLLARYFTSIGYRGVICGSRTFSYQPGGWFGWLLLLRSCEIPSAMNKVAVNGGYTYGSALAYAYRFRS